MMLLLRTPEPPKTQAWQLRHSQVHLKLHTLRVVDRHRQDVLTDKVAWETKGRPRLLTTTNRRGTNGRSRKAQSRRPVLAHCPKAGWAKHTSTLKRLL